MDIYTESLQMHKKNVGKIDVVSTVKVENEHDLSLAYTPGVARPCMEIAKNPDMLNTYTARGNMVAVVSDGSAVLGLGNIGAKASLPVMEGKCVLFKEFGGVSAFPVCINSQDSDTIVNTVKLLEPSFAGINLEDISAPRCFEIEDRLKAETGMLIFHDDQHGTAIVVLAGLINALKLSGRQMENIKVVINGAGAAGTAIAKLLRCVGADNIIVCDSRGTIYPGREHLNPAKTELAILTNPEKIKGTLQDAASGSDVFIGVSVAGALKPDMVAEMKKNPIIFAMANPEPEIKPDIAKKCGVKIMATGRSDYPNQVNNVLGFPAIFRGALDAKAKEINMEMKVASARALASVVSNELSEGCIIPKPFDRRVLPAVAVSIAKAAIETGAASRDTDLGWIERKAKSVFEDKTQ